MIELEYRSKEWFAYWEFMTYHILDKIQSGLESIIKKRGCVDLDELMDCAEDLLDDKNIVLPDEFEGDLFNFIDSSQFSDYIDESGIGIVRERCEYYVFPKDIKG